MQGLAALRRAPTQHPSVPLRFVATSTSSSQADSPQAPHSFGQHALPAYSAESAFVPRKPFAQSSSASVWPTAGRLSFFLSGSPSCGVRGGTSRPGQALVSSQRPSRRHRRRYPTREVGSQYTPHRIASQPACSLV